MRNVFCIICLSLLPLCAYAQEDTRSEYFVESVSIDPTLYNTQHLYMPDDPRLKNRVFFINESQLTSDTATGVCKKKDVKKVTLGKWFATTFKAYIPHTDSIFSVRDPADFNVPYSKQTVVSASGYNCDDLREKLNNGPKQVILPNKKLLLTWKRGGALLILRKLKPGERILPSFKCSQNNNETEKTICSSNALSGWDRSMLEALKAEIKQAYIDNRYADPYHLKKSIPKDSEEADAVINFQKKWLVERNKCKADKECITKQYNDEIEIIYTIAVHGGDLPVPQTEEEKEAEQKEIEKQLQTFPQFKKMKKQ